MVPVKHYRVRKLELSGQGFLQDRSFTGAAVAGTLWPTRVLRDNGLGRCEGYLGTTQQDKEHVSNYESGCVIVRKGKEARGNIIQGRPLRRRIPSSSTVRLSLFRRPGLSRRREFYIKGRRQKSFNILHFQPPWRLQLRARTLYANSPVYTLTTSAAPVYAQVATLYYCDSRFHTLRPDTCRLQPSGHPNRCRPCFECKSGCFDSPVYFPPQ
jgi:hypothetical protein